jgi:hypothetical protein
MTKGRGTVEKKLRNDTNVHNNFCLLQVLIPLSRAYYVV